MADLPTSTTPVEGFLDRHGLLPAALNADGLLEDFLAEMDRGLTGAGGSLSMIPAFLSIDSPVPANRPVVVIDAGGTNLRVAVVRFAQDGTPLVTRLHRSAMPGSERSMSKTEFFGALLEQVLPVAGESDSIGWCFSYPVEITPDRDGRLLRWTKEIRAPEVVGEFVGASLLALLRGRGHDPRVIVLNDTIATLLAGRSAGPNRRYDSYVGFILGTGTNTAYVERNSRITKCADLDPSSSQAVNVESGAFDRCPRSDLDAEFDASTATPGSNPLEKMVSGAYLGPLGLYVFRKAAAEDLFSTATARHLESLPALDTVALDRFLKDPFAAGPLATAGIPDRDRERLVQLGSAVVGRAARLAAVNIAAVAVKSGAGRSALRPICINVDGTTYYRTSNLQSLVEEHVRHLLVPRGIHHALVHVENAPMIGAAVAGLTP